MLRRHMLTGMGSLMIATSVFAAGGAQQWAAWKRRFLAEDGRVIDELQDGASHSEGQGYGMLLAQAHGDRAAFEAMESWAARVLAIRDDPLMAWRWLPDRAEGIPDWHNATDGDLFRAWALHRAERFSGWAGHGEAATRIANALAAQCLAHDPRAPTEWLLTPSAESPRSPGAVLLNPSYIMPRALRELGDAYGLPDLVRAADHGETVLRELSEGGLVPDWTMVTPQGFRRAGQLSFRHGYDALRSALFLAWSGRREHPVVRDAVAAYRNAPGDVPVVMDRDGRVITRSDLPGYKSLRDYLLCTGSQLQPLADEPYYPATLGLMARIALREDSSCTSL